MLWDLIRDFFVIHVFGGVTSEGVEIGGLIGSDLEGDQWLTNSLGVQINTFGGGEFTTLGDWLSTTATMISITIIVVLCCMFIYKIIKLIGGLIR